MRWGCWGDGWWAGGSGLGEEVGVVKLVRWWLVGWGKWAGEVVGDVELGGVMVGGCGGSGLVGKWAKVGLLGWWVVGLGEVG